MNDTSAHNSLGEVYKHGYGVVVYYKEAKKWFIKSAYGKNDKGQFNLGLMYFEGSITSGIDYALALL